GERPELALERRHRLFVLGLHAGERRLELLLDAPGALLAAARRGGGLVLAVAPDAGGVLACLLLDGGGALAGVGAQRIGAASRLARRAVGAALRLGAHLAGLVAPPVGVELLGARSGGVARLLGLALARLDGGAGVRLALLAQRAGPVGAGALGPLRLGPGGLAQPLGVLGRLPGGAIALAPRLGAEVRALALQRGELAGAAALDVPGEPLDAAGEALLDAPDLGGAVVAGLALAPGEPGLELLGLLFEGGGDLRALPLALGPDLRRELLAADRPRLGLARPGPGARGPRVGPGPGAQRAGAGLLAVRVLLARAVDLGQLGAHPSVG